MVLISKIYDAARLFQSEGSLTMFDGLALNFKVNFLYWLLFYFYIGGKVEEY